MAARHPYGPAASVMLRLGGLLCALALMALGGCATRQTIVLVPDPAGHVGKVEVATAGGTQVLARSGDMTRTSGSARPPSAVTTAEPAFIATTFGEALAVEPPPAEVFTLYFETGSVAMTSDSQQLVGAIAAAVQRRKAVSVSISGHTDATGSDALNDALALDRAKEIKRQLLQRGVKEEIIAVTSHGKGNPAVPTPEGVPEPRNRRVVVIVH